MFKLNLKLCITKADCSIGISLEFVSITKELCGEITIAKPKLGIRLIVGVVVEIRLTR